MLSYHNNYTITFLTVGLVEKDDIFLFGCCRRVIFDETAIPKHSEIFGISYAEIKERLSWLKAALERQTEEKRDSILQEKREKLEALIAAANVTKSCRNAMNKMTKQRYERVL